MEFYASPSDEMAAIRRAAIRSGCKVRALARGAAHLAVVDGISRIVPEPSASSTLGEIECTDGWAAARLLLSLAIEDSRTPGARELAQRLRGRSSTDAEFAQAVHSFVSAIPFIRERGEIFQSGALTIRRDGGDCDDHFRLAYALGVAGGLRAALGILHHGTAGVPRDKQGPTHAVAMFWLDGAWRYAETTVAACFGEPSNGAARRLGLTTDRTDIAKELRIMTEQDLPDVPEGYASRNSAAQVVLDAEALQRLGYLGADEPVCQMMDPTAIVLRRAVLAFQIASGLAPDGLLGAHTRETIARALSDAGVTDLAYPGIGALDTATPRASADLSDEFLLAVIAMASRFAAQGARAAPEEWLAVWQAESGIANIPNHAGQPYFGLNQMGISERQKCGFMGTTSEWLALSLVAQLPFVECFYVSAARMGGGAHVFTTAGSLYVANLAPALVGHAGDPGFALYRAPSDQYEKNKQLDRQHKGFISVDDMRVSAESAATGPRFAEVRARVRALGAAPPVPRSGVGIGTVVASVGILAMGWVAYAKGWF